MEMEGEAAAVTTPCTMLLHHCVRRKQLTGAAWSTAEMKLQMFLPLSSIYFVSDHFLVAMKFSTEKLSLKDQEQTDVVLHFWKHRQTNQIALTAPPHRFLFLYCIPRKKTKKQKWWQKGAYIFPSQNCCLSLHNCSVQETVSQGNMASNFLNKYAESWPILFGYSVLSQTEGKPSLSL